MDYKRLELSPEEFMEFMYANQEFFMNEMVQLLDSVTIGEQTLSKGTQLEVLDYFVTEVDGVRHTAYVCADADHENLYTILGQDLVYPGEYTELPAEENSDISADQATESENENTMDFVTEADIANLSDDEFNSLMDADQKFMPGEWLDVTRAIVSPSYTLEVGTQLEVISNTAVDHAGEVKIAYECVNLDRSSSYVILQSDLKPSETEPDFNLETKSLPLSVGDRVCKLSDPTCVGRVTEICDIYNGFDYMVKWDGAASAGGVFAKDIQAAE